MPRNLHGRRMKTHRAARAPGQRRLPKRRPIRRLPTSPWTPTSAAARPLPARGPALEDCSSSTIAQGCSLLIGAAAALLLNSGGAQLAALFDGPRRWAIAGGFLGLSLGIAVPRRMVLLGLRLAARWLPTWKLEITAPVLSRFDRADVTLLWMLLSGTTLIAGLLALLFPVAVRFVDVTYSWLSQRFLLSDMLLACHWFGLSALAFAAPGGAIGLAAVWCHRLMCPRMMWDTSTPGTILLGAAGGVFAASAIPAALGGPVAALPCLVACLLAARANQVAQNRERSRFSTPHAALPECSDPNPRLLRRSVAAVGAALVLGFTFVQGAFEEHFGNGAAPGVALAALAMGMLAGRREYSTTTVGFSMLGLALLASGSLLLADGLVRIASTFGRWSQPIVLAMAMMLIGHTFVHAHNLMLSRVAARCAAGTSALGRTLLTAAMAGPLAATLVHAKGLELAEWAMVVLLPVFGGYLLWADPQRARDPKEADLAGVW